MAENDITNDITKEKKRPAFDEQTLARVLEAAYVLQEHNRQRQKGRSPRRESAPAGESAGGVAVAGKPIDAIKPRLPSSPARPARQDFPLVLAQIVETQQRIQAESLDMQNAMDLIVGKAMQVAQAAGAGIGILEDGKVRYQAAAGSMALAVGTEVPVESALCSACLRVGQVIRCGSVNLEFLVDAEECARRGIESLIAAPIHNTGSIAGALELYYGEPQSFTEPDVHACQLMTGLAGEVLARREGLASRQSLQAERAAMRSAVEKLKPNLEAMVEPAPAASAPAHLNFPAPVPAPRSVPACCTKCGNEFQGDEQFCGKCGVSRNAPPEILSMQSKVALLWQMQEQKNKNAARNPAPGSAARWRGSAGAFEALTPEDLCETTVPDLGELLATNRDGYSVIESLAQDDKSKSVPNLVNGNLALDESARANRAADDDLSHLPGTGAALVKALPRANWTSAVAAREFLERVARENRNNRVVRFLKARRGDVYLVLAIILVAFVIRWGVWSDKPVSGAAPTTVSHRSVYADLSFFDRMLIKLGLADPPDPPVFKGNPDTKVWVDEQTALYYCPGADLYGKTPKGRMTTQRDAQFDQFEPAFRKACN